MHAIRLPQTQTFDNGHTDKEKHQDKLLHFFKVTELNIG